MTKTAEQLQKDVTDELRYEPLTFASAVNVAVNDGVVTLTGQVDTYSMKLAAERAVKRVRGVAVVVQAMTVKTPVSQLITDEQIGHAILSTFEWHTDIPRDKLTTEVQQGWITLCGAVDWQYQRQAAEQAVESLTGVRGVTNQIQVMSDVVAQGVKNKITNALQRRVNLEAQQIKVETKGSHVILSGTVRSFAQRQEVKDAAWAVSGVWSVEDNLTVTS